LQNLDYVEKVTSAEQTDGGAGCTVIWLKWLILCLLENMLPSVHFNKFRVQILYSD
jgi:hypothetical protein